ELGGAHGATGGQRGIDEGNTGAGTDVGRDGGARCEIVQQVGHHRDLVDLTVHEGRAARERHETAALVVAIEAFHFDARADEVVADLATYSVAGVVAVGAIVEQPVQPALGAYVDPRIRRPRREHLRVGRRHRQGDESCGAQQYFSHAFTSSQKVTEPQR